METCVRCLKLVAEDELDAYGWCETCTAALLRETLRLVECDDCHEFFPASEIVVLHDMEDPLETVTLCPGCASPRVNA